MNGNFDDPFDIIVLQICREPHEAESNELKLSETLIPCDTAIGELFPISLVLRFKGSNVAECFLYLLYIPDTFACFII